MAKKLSKLGQLFHGASLLFICFGISDSVHAQNLPEWRTGGVTDIYIDPGDVVLVLSSPGPCGSSFYHIQRSNLNFRELYAAMFAAFYGGKIVSLNVISCASGRNLVSHGVVKQ